MIDYINTDYSDTLNAEQACFVQVVSQLVINDKTPIQATLSGPAGTGKTHALQKLHYNILEASMRVQKLAPTNAAAKICGGITIHSYFGIRPIDPDAPIIEFDDTLTFNDEDGKGVHDVIIVDECSMIKDDMIDRISAFCKVNNVTLIWVGDEYQLPPVSKDEAEVRMNSCFNHDKFIQFKLTQIMRQKVGSAILPLADTYRQYDKFPNLLFAKGGSDVIKATDDSSWNEDTRIVAWTNKAVIAANVKINNKVLNNPQLFNAGQTIVVQHPFFVKKDDNVDPKTGEVITTFEQVPTGEELLINSSKPHILSVTDAKGNKGELKGFIITFFLDGILKYKFLLDYDEYANFDKFKKTYEMEWLKLKSQIADLHETKIDSTKLKEVFTGQSFKAELTSRLKRDEELRNFIDETAKNIKDRWAASKLTTVLKAYHSYASTVHKAQGQTHTRTMVYAKNISGALTLKNKEMYNRLAYVAVTRPTTELVIVGM